MASSPHVAEALAEIKSRPPPRVPQSPPPHKRVPMVPQSPKPGQAAAKSKPLAPSPLASSSTSSPVPAESPRRISVDTRLRRNNPNAAANAAAAAAAAESGERDRENEEGFDLDKSQWLAYALRKHPEILELRERLRPLSGMKSFGRLNRPARTEVPEVLSGTQILQLIMEHVSSKGYTKTVGKLEEESKLKFNAVESKDSRLVTLLRMGITDVDSVFDDTLPPPVDKDGNPVKPEEDEEVEVFAEGFAGTEEKDVNIWDEPDDDTTNVMYVEGRRLGDNLRAIRAASLNRLVERLTSEKLSVPDLKFRKTFLMTYPAFTSPERLLQKLIQRYHVPIPKEYESDEEWRVNHVRPVELRVCNVLKDWVDKHFADFLRDNIVGTLVQFVENSIARDGHHMLAKQIKGAIAKKQQTTPQQVLQMTERTSHSEPPPEPRVPKNIFSRSLHILDIDEEEVARQLTTIDYEIYASIQSVELQNQAWKVQKYQHRSPNVRNMNQRYLNFSLWVAWEILKTEKLKQRSKVWSQFVKIGEHLRHLRNFHSLSALMVGMTNPACARLKWTKEGAQKQSGAPFAELERLMSPDNGFRRYRDTLYTIDEHTACVPFLGAFLADISLIEEGSPDFVNGLVNFAKRQQVYSVLLEVQQYQGKSYNLQPVHQIQSIVLSIPTVDENELMELSLKREPRNCDRSQCS